MDHTTPTFKNNPAAALKLYFERGYHIEPHVFSDEECNILIEASKKLDNFKNTSYRPAMMPHRTQPEFLTALRHPTVAKIMNQLIGGTAAGIQTEFFYCKPGTPGFATHQDNFFVDAPENAFASAWTALTDITPEKGGLFIYPGAHKERLLPVEKINIEEHPGQDPNANNVQCIVPTNYPALNIPLIPKGATLFIHGHIPHASNTNNSNEYRYVLLSTYIRSGEKFRVGNYAQREEVAL